jgi:acyl-CoA thioester hydrolase
VAEVYTALLTVRHHEVDGFARVHPAVYLRYLAQAAVEASGAAGYDASWYAAAGTLWLVRRSTFAVVRPLRGGESLEIRTWVEDFRRVRSHRRYEIRDPTGALRVDARTDWVYVDAVTGRPRRVPPELERAFGAAAAVALERDAWTAPPPPAAPARSVHRVRAHELDGLAHVNNAVYLDLGVQAFLDALAGRGWPLARLVASAAVPDVAEGDVEYLEPARYGDRLAVATWLARERDGDVVAHQTITRDGEDRVLVRAATRWRWLDPARDAYGPAPAGLLDALASLGV